MLLGLPDLASFLDIQLKFFTPTKTNPMSYLVHGAIYFIAGFYLVCGAPLIAGIAYPPDSPQSDEKKDSAEESK
jgi:hypothetical protein